MKTQYLLIEYYEMEEFQNHINALAAQGYTLISHSLAIDTAAAVNTRKTYSAVLQLGTGVSEIKKEIDVSG